jgi:hypothetical protein
MHPQVQEEIVHMNRESMCNLGVDVDFFVRSYTDIGRDISVCNHMIIESRSQMWKCRTRKTYSATPNREKLTDGAILTSPCKDELQVNGTFSDVGSPLYTPNSYALYWC